MSGERLDGGTLYRASRAHPCKPPSISAHSLIPGDKWKCDCSSDWIVQKESSYDPRDPRDSGETVFWKRQTETPWVPNADNR